MTSTPGWINKNSHKKCGPVRPHFSKHHPEWSNPFMLSKAPKPEKDWTLMSSSERNSYFRNLGWKTIPLWAVDHENKCTCGRSHEHKLSGKHPVIDDWAERAMTATHSQNAKWFPEEDETGIGVYCVGSGFFAVDIDPRSGGFESDYRMECSTGGELPPTVEVYTGVYFIGGEEVRGIHRLYAFPSGERLIGKVKNWPGIDIKHNGYIVAAGSRHFSGVNYEFVPGRAPWEIEMAEAPEILLGHLRARHFGNNAPLKRISSLGDEEWQSRYRIALAEDVTTTPYAKKTLTGLESTLSSMQHGERNNTINSACFVAGQLIGGGQASYSECHRVIWDAARKNYGSDFDDKRAKKLEKVMREFGGGFELGAMNPRYQIELTEEQIAWAKSVSLESPKMSHQELVDSMQRGFLDNRGNLNLDTTIQALEAISPLSVAGDTQLWYYKSGVWHSGGKNEIKRNLHHLLGEKARPSHVNNVVEFVEARFPEIDGPGPEGFLNFKNGMLNWRTLDLLPHSQDFFSTYQINLDWNPQATCPTVDKFLDEVAEEQTVKLLLEVAGIAIYPRLGFHKAILLDGDGRNGKGTYLRLIEGVVPKSARASLELQRIEGDRFACAQLYGKVLNICGDIPRTSLSETSRFKMITGEDEISAEYKHRDIFTFTSQATLIFSANTLPESADGTKGFFSRMLIIPFDKMSLDDDHIDRTLEPRLHQELEGFVVKAVMSLRDAKSRGKFVLTERTQQALDAYRMTTDNVRTFSESCLVRSPADVVDRQAVFDHYRRFCESQELRANTPKAFYRQVQKLNNTWLHARQAAGGRYVFEGVQVIPIPQMF
jgi:putative DNA primase/helicase